MAARASSRMRSLIPDWLVMGDGCFRCLRCGKRETMPVPMPVGAFRAWPSYLGALHAHCQDVGRVDPVPTTVDEWIASDDTGTSSKAIYRHMQGIHRDASRFDTYPSDPSDFGRCYRLLALAPEWRARITEMAQYGPEWAALSGAWDELSALWEEERGGKMAPKLYARMTELHSPHLVPKEAPDAR